MEVVGSSVRGIRAVPADDSRSSVPSGLFADVRGAGMVEYMIVVGVIALISIAAFRFFGSSVLGKAQQQAGAVENNIPGGSDCMGVVCPR